MLQSRTYFLFAGLNLLWIPIVYLLYPETANRSLESIEAMFTSSSPTFMQMERAYRLNEASPSIEEQETIKEKAASQYEEHV